MKTTFSSGVVVTSAFLNGAKNIVFDGQDLDWHYNPLGLNSLVISGPNGLDSRYVSLAGDQPALTVSGVFVSGAPISGDKTVTGAWNFGYEVIPGPGNVPPNQNPANTVANAPLSFTTNDKYNYANGVGSPSIAQKYAALSDADIVTKKILNDQLSSVVLDNGTYS
jgi:hypothetical protein